MRVFNYLLYYQTFYPAVYMNLVNQNTGTGISFNSIYHKHIFNSIIVLKVGRITTIKPEDTFSPIYFLILQKSLKIPGRS